MLTENRKRELLAEDNGLFGMLMEDDLESAFSAGIACCDNCYDDFLSRWPLAYNAKSSCFQTESMDLQHFYKYFARRLMAHYSNEEFNFLIECERCPRCLNNFSSTGMIYPLAVSSSKCNRV
jgi:hypothetical protein